MQEVSRKNIDETIGLFQPLLASPLQVKLLAKPSFSFIQELVKSLITETRILRNVFAPADFDTKRRVWDRRMKVDFVQRLLDFVVANGEPLTGCSASKVVAGLQPNKTHQLLQSLAKVARVKREKCKGEEEQQRQQPRPGTFTRSRTHLLSNSEGIAAKRNSSSATLTNELTGTNEARKSAKGRQVNREKRKGSSSSGSVSPKRELEVGLTLDSDLESSMTIEPNGNEPIVIVQQKPQQQQLQETYRSASESEISKGVQYLRLDLRQLKSVMSEVVRLLDCSLKESLVEEARGMEELQLQAD